MVERIYGGRHAVLYDKSALFSSPRALRFSSEKSPVAPGTNLETICETTDEISANISPCGSALSLYCGDACIEPGPLSYRKPRAMSLPAIYRDGSYVKLKNQIVNLRKTSLNKPRRFSAPSGPSTNMLYSPMPRFTRRVSAGSNTALPTCRETIFKLKKSGKSGNEILENNSSYSEKNYKTKELRRHSDPLLYSTIPLSPDNATETKKNVENQLIEPATVEARAASPAIPNSETIEKSAVVNSCSRPRRKSSLVPVPFRMPETQKRKQTAQKKSRPLSFPPAKEHQGKIRSLQSSTDFISALLKETFSPKQPSLTLRYPSSVHIGWDVALEKGKLDRLCLDENTEEGLSHSDFCTRAERIVQWMNFFG